MGKEPKLHFKEDPPWHSPARAFRKMPAAGICTGASGARSFRPWPCWPAPPSPAAESGGTSTTAMPNQVRPPRKRPRRLLRPRLNPAHPPRNSTRGDEPAHSKRRSRPHLPKAGPPACKRLRRPRRHRFHHRHRPKCPLLPPPRSRPPRSHPRPTSSVARAKPPPSSRPGSSWEKIDRSRPGPCFRMPWAVAPSHPHSLMRLATCWPRSTIDSSSPPKWCPAIPS